MKPLHTLVAWLGLALSLGCAAQEAPPHATQEVHWVDIAGHERVLLRVDEASMVPFAAPAPSALVTWRKRVNGRIRETESVINCVHFELVNSSVRSLADLGFRPAADEPFKPVQDDAPVKLPVIGSPEGALIEHVCAKLQPEQVTKLRRWVADCAGADAGVALLCPGSDDLRLNTMLFAIRSRMLAPACGESEEVAQALYEVLFFRAHKCPDQACAEREVLNALRLVSRDLEAVRTAEVDPDAPAPECRAVKSLSGEVKERLQDVAMQGYQACVFENLPPARPGGASDRQRARSAHAMCLAPLRKLKTAFGIQRSDNEVYGVLEPKVLKWIQSPPASADRAARP